MNRKLIFLYICTIIYSQDIYINDIEINGLETITQDQIFRISGLFPCESFSDENGNNKYDFGENFIDNNNNNYFDVIYLRKGDEINQAIKNLWSFGVFSDVQYFITNSNNYFIDLRLDIVELPIVEKINFSGNKKIKSKFLRDVILINEQKRFSENDLIESIILIKNEYINKDYHNIRVEVSKDDNKTNSSQNINFIIDEGKKIKVKKINFKGNNNFSKNELIKKAFTEIKEKKWLLFKSKFKKEDLDLDLDNLANFYKKNGYRDFRVLNKSIEYLDDGVYLLFDLHEGEINYYRDFIFTGNSKFSDKELLDALGIKAGDIFNKEKFDLSVFQLNSKYFDVGYYFLENKYNIQPNENNQLDVYFNIIENSETRIRKIIISGNDKTNDNVIRRELKIYPNDVFSMKKLQESYGDVFRLNFFENIDPEIIPVNASRDKVDINFKVIEKETGRANFSMGYNQEYGLTGGGGFEFINFLGRGQLLSVDYSRGLQQQSQLSGSNVGNDDKDFQSFSINFREPRINNTVNSIGISFAHTERGRGSNSYLEYDINSDRLSLSLGRKFKWPDYFFRGGWTISYRNTKYLGTYAELDDYFSDDIIHGSGENAYASRVGISITQKISRDSRNHPEYPTDGSSISWTTTFSGDFLGGNENYHKHVFDFKWYSPLIDKLAISQDLTFGALKEMGDNLYLPYSARFLLGGSGIPYGEMLRGYGDNSIYGYSNSSGGKIMFKYSIESRYLLSNAPTIYLLLFAEAGNVWSDFNEFDLYELKRSLGCGFRIYMPMLGILGYDVGYGFDSIDPQDNSPYGWEQHLIFGMPFN